MPALTCVFTFMVIAPERESAQADSRSRATRPPLRLRAESAHLVLLPQGYTTLSPVSATALTHTASMSALAQALCRLATASAPHAPGCTAPSLPLRAKGNVGYTPGRRGGSRPVGWP
jgi:hypothetical protein